MGAKQIRCPRLSSESRAAQTQTGSQRERHDPEARDHPQGVHVGVELEQRVACGGVQSLHLVYCALWQIGQQPIQGALNIVFVAGLEREKHLIGRFAQLRVRTQQQIRERLQQRV